MRMRHNEMIQRKRDLFYSSAHSVQIAESQLAEPEPRGFWNRLLGKHREWSERQQQASLFLGSIERARTEVNAQLELLERQIRPLERQYQVEQASAEKERAERRQSAEREVELVDAANTILDGNPALARDVDALMLAAEQRIRDEEMRLQSRQDVQTSHEYQFRL